MRQCLRILPNSGKSQDFCQIMESCGLQDWINELFIMTLVKQEKYTIPTVDQKKLPKLETLAE
jgi:hypothetical protein